MSRIDQIHHATSFFRFVREMQFQVAPTRIQDALGQMAVLRHVDDLQIFQRNPVVAFNQIMRQFIQAILAPPNFGRLPSTSYLILASVPSSFRFLPLVYIGFYL